MKRQKVQSDLLDNLYLSSPCSISWDSMQGDDRKRSCGGCSRNVYNLSSMTKNEAEAFLAENGTNHCVIFYRRQDGTVMTDDCPIALRKIRDRLRVVTRVAAGLVAFVVSLPAAFAQGSNTPQINRGDMRQPYPGEAVFAHPAGGISIMPPRDVQTNVQKNVSVKVITVTEVDITKKNAVKTAHPDGRNVINQKQVKERQTKRVVHKLKASPLENENLDKNAFNYYTKSTDALASGNKEMAEFYAEKAIESFDKQKAGDQKFRALLERQLKSIQSK